MTSDDRIPNLLFLFSLSPLVAGCPSGDDTGSGETTASTTPMTTGTSTGAADSTGPEPATTSGMEGSSGSSTAAVTTDADTTGGDTTGGLYCEDTPPMKVGPIEPVCVELANQQSECYYDGGLSQVCLDYYQAACQYGIEYAIMTYGEMCGMVTLEFYACIAPLSCAELEQPDVCNDEFMALIAACGGM